MYMSILHIYTVFCVVKYGAKATDLPLESTEGNSLVENCRRITLEIPHIVVLCVLKISSGLFNPCIKDNQPR